MRSLPVILLLLCSCDPYKTAWSTTSMVREAAFQTEAGLARMAREKSQECLGRFDPVVKPYRDCAAACPASEAERKACLAVCTQRFGAATQPYRDCLGQYPGALDRWIKVVRPTVNSALTLTVTALQLAERSRDKTLPWLEYLKPALCAVCTTATQWEQMLPGNVKTMVALACKFVTTATCKEAK
jgi:hypothetical protein